MRGKLEEGRNVFAFQIYEQLLVLKRVSMLLLSVAIMTALAAAGVEAQQVGDDTYNPPIQNPAYPQNSGPVVAIDEAHNNFHRMTVDPQNPDIDPPRFKPFADLLKRDGYRVRPSTSQFSAQSLQGVDILVIANPLANEDIGNWSKPNHSAFSDAEIQAVRTWVEQGGSLWLIADHMPWPAAAEGLAAAFGVRKYDGFALDENAPNSTFVFRRSDGSLAPSPIIDGRSGYPSDRVNTVASFTGSAFQVDGAANAQPLLILAPQVTLLLPDEPWEFDPPGQPPTPRINAGGWPQGAALRFGQGRVAVFGEAAMFTAQKWYDEQGNEHLLGMNQTDVQQENYKFVLNISHWLSGLLDQPTGDTTKPTITITTPPDGEVYTLNQAVTANYTCQDEAGGSGLRSCQGTVANGSAIDTASTGPKTFTVTATDNAGNQNSVTRTYSVVASTCTIRGTAGSDTINGTAGADVICPLDGNDTVNGNGGNDTIKSSWGADVLNGGAGNDTLEDLSGTDRLSGGNGRDVLDSRDGQGSDRVDGNDGTDSCSVDTNDILRTCP